MAPRLPSPCTRMLRAARPRSRNCRKRPSEKWTSGSDKNDRRGEPTMTDRLALSRRHFLWQSGGGLGAIALAWMLDREARAGEAAGGGRRPHFTPKARRVIQIFCAGGVSHVDTFDGQPGRLMKSPFAFRRRGQSGLWVSDLLPHLAGCADDLTFFYSMVGKTSNHTPATFQMNTGFTMNGFPCLGSWLSYGLGSDNQDLPAFVVLTDPRGLPAGGAINWT